MSEYRTEIWKDIPGFAHYQVSQLGRVRSNIRTGGKPWRILKLNTQTSGYKSTWLKNDDGGFQFRLLHILVADIFFGPCPEGYCVHHIEKDKTKNGVDDIEYKRIADHISDHQAFLTRAERAEIRYLYMNHIDDIGELGRAVGWPYSVVYYAVKDLKQKYDNLGKKLWEDE